MTKRNALLILTHYETPRIARLIERARSELGATTDVFVAAFFDDPARLPALYGKYDFAIPFYRNDFAALGYPEKYRDRDWRFIPGNADLIPAAFWKRHPGYQYYWSFEGDVDYTGRLDGLVDHFASTEADLLCTHVRPHPRNWPHAHRLRLPDGWKQTNHENLIAFLPVFRTSARFMEELDQFHRQGGAGHHERTWPLVALDRGLKLEEIGGRGRFTDPRNRGRFYTAALLGNPSFSGSFRYRPVMRATGSRPNTLWHPIKEDVNPWREWLNVARRQIRRLVRKLSTR